MKFFYSILIFIVSFSVVFAYSDDTTHPGLTDEIVDLFNFYYPENKISDEYKELAKKGSTDEDKKPRSMYHFYDPVYNRGIHMAGTKWQSSKDWAVDTMAQASFWDQAFAGSLTSYFGSSEDHSWDRAIYEYAWGDKERAMYDLGHIVHLIEDASVPDHTRNDPHPPWFHFGSPYEAWTSKFGPEQMDGLAKSLFDSRKKLIALDDIQSYFESIATYSNNNFFSKDTIFNKDYSNPLFGEERLEKLSDGKLYNFGYKSNNQDKHKLVLVGQRRLGSQEISYSIEDIDKLILSDYWDRLSKQAVLHGAGVVKLFFDEVEKEKKTQALYNKNKSWFVKAYDATKSKIFGIAGSLYGTSVSQDDLAELNNSKSVQPPTLDTPPPPPVGGPPPLNVRGGGERDRDISFGGGVTPSPYEGGGNERGEVQNVQNRASDNSLEETPPPSTLGVSAPTPSVFPGGGPFNTPRIPPVGDNENISSSTPDTIAPDLTFSISECSSSLSGDGCLVANSSLSISWSSTSTDIASYDIECSLSGNSCSGFSFSATSATSTNYALPTDEKTYQFRARARDATGNISGWSTINVEYYSSPVVINEVAWGGTSASAFDEWIELRNKTGKSISLSNWVLYAQDLVPYINLSNSILANGYYLIERTDDTTVSDISADLIAEFSGVGGGSGLSNSGEVLVLSTHSTSSGQEASTTIDQTVLCSSNWCGGSNSNSSGRPSMERVDPFVAGTNSANWGSSNYLVTQNGKDSANSALYATPKKRNSLNYLISQNGVLSANKTLAKSNSPYVVPTSQDFVVNAGATLTIEPGVVIKMGDQSSIAVSGDIISSGTASDKITFTSLYDDSYEGDTNGDGSASSPAAGSWKYVRIQSPSQNSQINYTRFKYGGRYFTSTALDARAMLSIYEATTTISNSTFEESQIAGLRATRFNGTISGNTFNTGTTTNTDKVGLYLYEGNPTISNNTFTNNYQGLNVELSQATSTISGSSFASNYIGLYLTLAKVNLDNLTFSNNTTGIQSSLSTINIITPGSITFTNNTATTSPGGLF